MKKTVRVRFAPSPTGPLHIGGVRTALYNYLFAKKNKGQFILRIEDTDQKRLVEGAEEYIISSLAWAGITFDEGVHVGGKYSPYKQSERSEIYKKYIHQLLNAGHAYYAFDTPEELDQVRNEFQLKKETFQYDAKTRMFLRNSLSLSKEEVKELIEKNTPYVVRVRIPEDEEIVVNDLIRGEVRVSSSLLDDKVLFKSDGLPTYHLANVVDDYLMEITHVIRGEEWLPSAPLHVLLYKFLDCAEKMPAFAHLPLILKPEGNGKLSKRDGDKHGFPVFPKEWKDPVTKEISSGYKESGYFPEAFVNMLALLGWNSGTEQEIFKMEELIELFSIERINKSGAKFDPEKSKWFNQQYLRKKDIKELTILLMDLFKKKNIVVTFEKAEKICSLYRERVNFISEIEEQSRFLFTRPIHLDKNIIQKKCKSNTTELLEKLINHIFGFDNWQSGFLHESINAWLVSNELSAGQVMLPLRLALVGELKGPEVFDILELLGKDESLARIKNGIEFIRKSIQ
ncbi:MAG: glutamate--tRNA ligase [Bacteroidales bacterium]|nr:glutamate--tRNA ligase [Bacteroidales bacterium]